MTRTTSRLSATMSHVLLCVDARLSAKVNAGRSRERGCSIVCRCHVFNYTPLAHTVICLLSFASGIVCVGYVPSFDTEKPRRINYRYDFPSIPLQFSFNFPYRPLHEQRSSRKYYSEIRLLSVNYPFETKRYVLARIAQDTVPDGTRIERP